MRAVRSGSSSGSRAPTREIRRMSSGPGGANERLQRLLGVFSGDIQVGGQVPPASQGDKVQGNPAAFQLAQVNPFVAVSSKPRPSGQPGQA